MHPFFNKAFGFREGKVASASSQDAASQFPVQPPREGAATDEVQTPAAHSDLHDFEILSHDQTSRHKNGLPSQLSLESNAQFTPIDRLRPPKGQSAAPPVDNPITSPEQTLVMDAETQTGHITTGSQASLSTSRYGRKRRSLERRRRKHRISPKDLRDKRTSLFEDRLRARELRNALRHQRSVTTDADIAFMDALRVFAAENPSLQTSTIFTLYEDCQKARDLYQPLEDNYNTAENLLDQKDFELGEIEYENLTREESEVFEPNNEDDVSAELDGMQDSSVSIGSDAQFTRYPPVVLDYLSRIGDANLIRERLDDLRGHRATLVEHQQSREHLGIPLDPESEQFLADFDNVHTQLLAQLADAEDDISRAKTSCERAGLLNGDGTVQNEEDEQDEGVLTFGSTRTDRDSLLLRDQDKRLTFSDISIDSTETWRINKAKFIDRWFLVGLRGSRLEISHLKSLPNLQALNVDGERLNELVLEWWPKDTATDYFRSRTTQPPGQSLVSQQSEEEDTRRAASLGQAGRVPFGNLTFSLASF